MVYEFKKEKWYKYTGNGETDFDDDMDDVKDEKPRKCIYVDCDGWPEFEGIQCNDFDSDDFDEVPAFEVNKWYKYTGNGNTSFNEDMQDIKNGKPWKCLKSNGFSKAIGSRDVQFVKFRGMDSMWNYDFKDFEEVPDTPEPGNVRVTEFVVGKWYKFVGRCERGQRVYWAERMSLMNDGKPRRCVKATTNDRPGRGKANFEGIKCNNDTDTWTWDFCDFDEVPAPSGEVTEFETGKWYKYVGRGGDTGWTARMQTIRDGKPQKCIAGLGQEAQFERTGDIRWNWFTCDFDEVPAPDSTVQNNGDEVEKMEAPKTQLDKQACKEAKEEEKKKIVEVRKERYAAEVRQLVSDEKNARMYKKRSEEAQKLLGMTKADMEQFFD